MPSNLPAVRAKQTRPERVDTLIAAITASGVTVEDFQAACDFLMQHDTAPGAPETREDDPPKITELRDYVDESFGISEPALVENALTHWIIAAGSVEGIRARVGWIFDTMGWFASPESANAEEPTTTTAEAAA
jgi:hypothetical protein